MNRRRMTRRSGARVERGHSSLEFAAVFAVLVLLVLVPLVDLVAIPIRMAFAVSAVKDSVRNLALSEKFSLALAGIEGDSMLKARVKSMSGVELVSARLGLFANSKAGVAGPFSKPGTLPPVFLPDGPNPPYHYNLVLTAKMDISPLFLLSGSIGEIPGLSAPFRATIEESFAWENLSKDAATKQFYLNE